MKILVAMSGGVDSSVTACLLKEQGYDVVGVRFRIWSDPDAPTIAQLLPSKCCNAQTLHRATTVSQMLGIELKHIDLQNAFKEKVVEPFLEEYRKGRTPNPCVVCNKMIKFDVLLHMANELQCDKIATGHYARIVEDCRDGNVTYRLFESIDARKSQAYFLYTLTQETLARTLFPLGTFRKADTIARARHIGIPLPAQYEESQDVCFYPEKEPKEFLKRHLKDAIAPGPIQIADGTTVGEHKGLPLYTVGQRKGLNVGGLKIPLYVVRKDVASNTLFVAPSGADRELNVCISSLNWIADVPREGTSAPMQARMNSQGQKLEGTLIRKGTDATFRFTSPRRSVAHGQSAVFYDGEEVLGGGVIT